LTNCPALSQFIAAAAVCHPAYLGPDVVGVVGVDGVVCVVGDLVVAVFVFFLF